MDTQNYLTVDELIEIQPRIMALLLSEHYDDSFDVNELSVVELHTLSVMAAMIMAIELFDHFSSGDDVSACNKDDDGDDDSSRIVEDFRQFFIQNGHVKMNTLKFLDKLIDECAKNSDPYFQENFTRVREMIIANRKLYQNDL